MFSFKLYTLFSVVLTLGMIGNAIQKYETFFNIVVYLSSQKINLLVFFNFLVVVLINFVHFLIWIFFDQIRTIESKYIMDKSQKKLFHFLLLSLILRSTFDIYKFISLSILFSFWVLHWLVYKRSDYLISRGSRGKMEHAKLVILYNVLIGIDFIITYTFYDKFSFVGERMNEIYVIIGFEFVRLMLKSIEDSFKYSISLVEMMYREQWTEKSFKLFAYIISRQQFPLYMLGEIIDNFVRLGKSIQLFVQSRSLINKLKRLSDVSQEDLMGMDKTCIICLEEIKKAKKLNCGHIFHLNCLRRWLEQNVQCPTCRCKIELDANVVRDVQQREQERNQRALLRNNRNQRRRIQIDQQQPVAATEEERKAKTEEEKAMDELTKELIEETKKNVYGDSSNKAKEAGQKAKNDIKDLFKIDEDELMDLIDEQQHMRSSESSNDGIKKEEEVKKPEKESLLKRDELGFAKTINKTLFESHDEKDERNVRAQANYQNPFDLKSIQTSSQSIQLVLFLMDYLVLHQPDVPWISLSSPSRQK